MKKRSNYILYSIIILSICFYTFLTGCGSSASDFIKNPSGPDNSNIEQTNKINITPEGRVRQTSSPSGMLLLEAFEANTYNPNVLLTITESPSVGNESSILTIGSKIYTIKATRNKEPVNMLVHPLNLIFSNEKKLSGAQNYFVGIKEINGDDWQFVNVYSTNSSARASISSSSKFNYSLLKNNVQIALFSDVHKSLQDAPQVLDITTTLNPSTMAVKDSLYSKDLQIKMQLKGDNLSSLNANNFKIKVGYFTSNSQSTALKVDGSLVNNTAKKDSNKYEAFGEYYAHEFSFVPLNSKYSSGLTPELSFDLNLKGLSETDFSNSFIVEISSADSKSFLFAFSFPLLFTKYNSESEPEPEQKATVSLKSPSTDFQVSNPNIELELSKDISWNTVYIDKITIDNNAEISEIQYTNKILTLKLKNKLRFDTLYIIKISDLDAVENNTFALKTEKIAVQPVISITEDSLVPNMSGRTVLKPKLNIDFGKPIASNTLALSNIKFNDANLPEGCDLVFNADQQNATLSFTSNLQTYSDYKLSINAYTDEDNGNVKSVEFAFKTMTSENLDGSGTIDDPFLIYHQGHLSQLNNTAPINYLSGNYFFKQMDDIELTGNWTPIGDETTPFKGHYNGNNKSISNINISENREYCGLFGKIEQGSVYNLTIRDSHVDGGDNYIGLLCGNLEKGIVENIKMEGTNTFTSENNNNSGNESGCLIGYANQSTIRKCQLRGKLEFYKDSEGHNSSCGGLIGNSFLNEISECCVDSPEGIIKGHDKIGGLVGNSMSNNINNCYSRINIEFSDMNSGGFYGSVLDSTITNCYSDCQITTSYYTTNLGGFSGEAIYTTIRNSYASGTIIINSFGANSVGTIAGFNDSSNIDGCFSSVKIVTDESYSDYEANEDWYNPAAGTPLWFYRDTAYVYDDSGSCYFGNGYKTTLGWNPAYWLNLTQGSFPKLIRFNE
ncbi:MAG: hypothetical protein IKO19_04420 [Candidatus Riflebacteria bacterium]|nr:hypothetical protein [Candidatus Riflebacteria bacterium]